MTEIITSKNKGYNWYHSNGVYFKGYFQTKDGEVYKDEKARNFLLSIHDYNEFLNVLKSMFGQFCVIVETSNDEIWGAVDIARSMPIYYSDDCTVVSDSAETIRNKCAISREDTDPYAMIEMYEKGFVAFDNTVYGRIKQIPIGSSFVIKNNQIDVSPYFIHTSIVMSRTKDELIKELETITSRMVERVKKVAKDCTIVLSLSGGYDSRYVACSLKKNGVDDVICYTYGKTDSFEVKQSKKVAEALGYLWINVEYSQDDVKELISNVNDDFFYHSTEHDFTIYYQNFIAIRELKKKGCIPTNSIFLTGLCNDMPSGLYTPNEDVTSRYPLTVNGVAQYITDLRFIRPQLHGLVREKFVSDVEKRLNTLGVNVYDRQSFVSAFDCIYTEWDHSRRFLHMNDAHTYFGYEFMLPCWDRELLEFWYSVPEQYRLNQGIYEEYITKILAAEYGVGTKKIKVANSDTSIKGKVKRLIGCLVVKVAYPLGIPINRKSDINNFALMEVALYKEIKQKKAIIASRAGKVLFFHIFSMEKKYGTKWYGQLKKYL